MSDGQQVASAEKPGPMEGTDIPDAFDPNKLYDVQLHTAFQVGPVWMTPAHGVTLQGSVCEEHRDKIWKAQINGWGIQGPK